MTKAEIADVVDGFVKLTLHNPEEAKRVLQHWRRAREGRCCFKNGLGIICTRPEGDLMHADGLHHEFTPDVIP